MRAIRSFFLVLGLLAALGPAWGQSWPDKTRVLRFLTPHGVGGAGDLLARALARGVTELYGINTIVENKPGAEGVIGLREAKNAPADGYTVLVTSSSNMVLNPHMVANLPYDPVADFIPLVGVSSTSLLMLVGPSVPHKAAREFVAAARGNPGKLTYGSSTTTTRLAGELLQRQAGIKLLNVPYKSLTDAMTALAAGQIDLVLADAGSAGPAYSSGRVRALAVTGSARSTVLPNLPTLREEGVTDYELTAWFGTYVPAKTAPEIVAALRDMLRKAARTAPVTQLLATSYMDPLEVAGDQLTTLQRAEAGKWGELVRAANLAPPK